MSQKQIFLDGEAAAYAERNPNPPCRDHVSQIMRLCRIAPKSILEIGCGNGWRLRGLGLEYGARTAGVDPLAGTTADDLPFAAGEFDAVIFGFCLYLVDRSDIFRVVAEADRVLRDGGHLIINDFPPPSQPYACRYKHCDGVLSYHMDYEALFLANATYSKVWSFGDPHSYAALLQKNEAWKVLASP